MGQGSWVGGRRREEPVDFPYHMLWDEVAYSINIYLLNTDSVSGTVLYTEDLCLHED
jgi:hypothetical protein